MKTPTRRESLKLAGGALSLAAFPTALLAQDQPVDPLQRFPRLVHNFYLQRLRRAEARGLALKAEIQNQEDAEAYVKSVQDKIRSCFAPFPKEKGPLNAKITGVIERDTYRIEKVLFQSRPRFWVTANLYVPKGREFPLPGVVGTCGHSAEGKAAEAYQSFAQGLARMGYVVLIYDPVGQGERNQYFDEEDKLVIRSSTHQHNQAGNQQVLLGEFFGTWRAWDGIRALDYLLSREEVDPKHVGVTGNSGGGTMTTWLCGVEQRWTMAAPSCFVTTWRRNLENELPQDSEQCPPRSVAQLLDHDDYLAALAPKPIIILSKEKDYFDTRGSTEVLERLKRLYAHYGKEENVELFTGPTQHGYSQENREAMYRFFNKVTGISDAKTEPELTMEDPKDLWCAKEGEVHKMKSKSVFDFTVAKSKALEKRRGTPQGEELKKAVIQTLKMPRAFEDTAPDFRILRWRGPGRNYTRPYFINYAVETEPGMQAIVTMLTQERWNSRPPKPTEGASAILYVSHHSADEELQTDSHLRDLLSEAGDDAGLFAMDVRGIGESMPGTTGTDPFGYYGGDYFYATYANMLNKPYVGGKTFDVLRVLDWLGGMGYAQIHLVAQGWGAVPGTFAAYLSDHVNQVTLKHALTSYQDVTRIEHYQWPLSSLVPGVLRHYDLPDLYRALGPKELKQIDPWNAEMEPVA